MIEAALTLLSLVGGVADVGGFYLDHPHPFRHETPAGEMVARCANAFRTFQPDTGLWKALPPPHGDGLWHHCPPGQ